MKTPFPGENRTPKSGALMQTAPQQLQSGGRNFLFVSAD
jgi:hypothetical protein